MEVKIAVSARHVHLTKEDFEYLFGKCELTKLRDLTQTGEYASNETVSLITEKDRIDNVRIIGPLRSYTQVEISKTDSYKLGLNPPVRSSGDLVNSSSITIFHDGKTIVKQCCIIANRHIHVNSKDMAELGLKDNEIVKLKLPGIKGGIIDNVFVKSSDKYVFEAHIDVDDANAHLINSGDVGVIINE